MSKKIVFTIIIAGFLAAAVFTFTIQSNQYSKEVEEKKQENVIVEEKAVKEKMENSRTDIMLAVSQQMNGLSPYETTGMWFPVKFWFDRNDAENQYVYVDYEDGHYMYRVLLEVFEVDNGLEFSIIGKFELGEDEWGLKEGVDTLYGKIFDIYNWNPDTNQANKIN